jgi:hypothetical protein
VDAVKEAGRQDNLKIAEEEKKEEEITINDIKNTQIKTKDIINSISLQLEKKYMIN